MKIEQLAAGLLDRLKEKQQTLATAESCTGGGIGYYLTAIPGSSAAYAGGVISYTNQVKNEILGVPSSVLEEHGAVSAQTATAMAQGVRELLHTDFGLGVTGLAGPDGDGSDHPVGTVYVAAASLNRTAVEAYVFSGSREEVREQAVVAALNLLDSIV